MAALLNRLCTLFLPLMMLLTSSVIASEESTQEDSKYIREQLDILFIDDTANRLNLDQVKKLPNGMYANAKTAIHKPETLDFSVWYRISLNDYSSGIESAFSVTIDNPTLDHINFYLMSNNKVVETKSLGDMSDNQSALDFVVPQISLFEGFQSDKVLYVHVTTNGASATPVIIESVNSSQYRASAQLMLLGSFFGVAMIMIIYNFFMFRGIGDPSYLNYIGYVFFAGFTISLINGFTFYVFPHDLAKWINQHLMISHFCGLAFAIRFAVSFLRFDTIKSWFVELGNRLSQLMFVFAFCGIFLTEATMTPIYFAAVGTVYVYAIILMSNVIKSRLMWVKYYLASWLPLFVGVGVGIAAFNGAIVYNFVTRNGAVFGVLAEICIMAVALMDRFRANEVDKEYRINHDPVTGLPNQIALEGALRRLSAMRSQFTLAVFEVPQAKEIIPALGVESANKFFRSLFSNIESYTEGLSSVYKFERIGQNMAYHVARISDSNFAIIFIGDLADESLEYNLLTVQEAVSTLIDINGVAISVGCAAGVVSYPVDSNEGGKLQMLALQALREGKKSDQHWARFDQKRSENMRKRFEIAADLQKAIEEDDLELFHQPQIDINSGDIHGSELLLRWIHPEEGFISPDYIIEIAEETGVIHQLTEWVIERGLAQHDKLNKIGFHHSISINISGKDLNDNGLVAHILTTTSQYNLEAESITFEITESATAEDPRLAKRILTELYEQGFKIAIDDFGTGYSSLDYLSQLPFHELKIDKCFMNLDVSDRNRTITEVTVALARRLGVKAVAEGIENKEVEQMLREFGCPIGQGYMYSKPMPFIEYMRWLQDSDKMAQQG